MNKKILNSSEFESSLKYVKHTDINKIYIWAFTSRNYLLIMIVNKLITTLYNIKKLLNTVVKWEGGSCRWKILYYVFNRDFYSIENFRHIAT